MKLKFPAQLILLTLVTGLAIAGWIFIDSCKHRVVMDLETIYGDPSYLDDKKIEISLESERDSNVSVVSNLFVAFPVGSVAEDVFVGTGERDHDRKEVYQCVISQVRTEEIEWNDFSIFSPGNGTWNFPNEILVTKDPLTYSIWGNLWFQPVVINGVSYLTLPSLLFTRVFTDKDHAVLPVEYTAQSGIWLLDEGSEPALENVVPLTISGPSGSSEVYGIYATEDEGSVVLITLENKVDLYATFYDIRTKIANDPVLIYHSDNGQVEPIILQPNHTCPIGSILLKFQNGGENSKTYYALALRENAETGQIESIGHPMDEFKWSSVFTYPTRVFQVISKSKNNHIYGPSEIYYYDEELWIVSYHHGSEEFDFHDRGSIYSHKNLEQFYLLSENPESRKLFYEKTDSMYSQQNATVGSLYFIYSDQITQEFLIQGYRDNALFYEGVLSVDLSVANLDSRNEDKTMYGKNYRTTWNDIYTRVNFIAE